MLSTFTGVYPVFYISEFPTSINRVYLFLIRMLVQLKV